MKNAKDTREFLAEQLNKLTRLKIKIEVPDSLKGSEIEKANEP